MANLAWYHNLLVPDSYHALKVSCSLLGLAGVYGFFRAARIVQPDVSTNWLYLLGLFPSILFWSSILGKDPIVFFGLGFYAWGVAGVLCSRNHTGPWPSIALLRPKPFISPA